MYLPGLSCTALRVCVCVAATACFPRQGSLLVVALLSFAISVLMWRTGSGSVGAALLQLSVLGAMVSYVVCLSASIVLTRRGDLTPAFKVSVTCRAAGRLHS